MKSSALLCLTLLCVLAAWPLDVAAGAAPGVVAERSAAPAADPPLEFPIIKILYYIRPPYYLEDPAGGIRGLVVDPLLKALALAKWPTRWEVLPAQRQLERIQANGGVYCALGWFQTPERETFARFSDEIFRDSPLVALARADIAGLEEDMDLGQLMADPALTLLVKHGFSYGAHADGLMADLHPRRFVSGEDNAGLLRLALEGRGDYLLIAPEEVEHLFATGEYNRAAFRIIHLRDAPSGNSRRLMCTQQTPEAFLQRVNLGLQGVPYLPPQ